MYDQKANCRFNLICTERSTFGAKIALDKGNALEITNTDDSRNRGKSITYAVLP